MTNFEAFRRNFSLSTNFKIGRSAVCHYKKLSAQLFQSVIYLLIRMWADVLNKLILIIYCDQPQEHTLKYIFLVKVQIIIKIWLHMLLKSC